MIKKLSFTILLTSLAIFGASFLMSNEAQASLVDGSFVRASTSPVVYQIDAGQKRAVPSANILLSWTSWSNVKLVSATTLAAYPSASAIGFKNETLISVSGNPTVYVVKHDKRYAFSSATAFYGLGYSFSKVRAINSSDLKFNPSAGVIKTEHLIEQEFVQNAGGAKYYAKKGDLREVTSANVYVSWGSPALTYTITDWQREIYREGAPMSFADYALIRQAGTSTVYLVVNGKRRAFSSQAILEDLHYSMDDVIDVSAAELALNSLGAGINSTHILPQSSLVQAAGKTIYRIDNNYRRAFPAGEIFLSHGTWGDIRQITLDTLLIYQRGALQGFANSALIRADGSPAVYLIIDEERRPFISSAAFLTFGYSWGQVRVINPKNLQYNPPGAAIDVPEDAAAMKQEGNIKIGIYKNVGGVRVAGSGTYYAKTADGHLIAALAGNIISGVGYINGQYRFSTTSGQVGYYDSYIRFIPASGTVLQLVDYVDKPSTVNYNRFRGVIEARRSTSTGEFWAINDLPLETYLKGLGEAYDSFPAQYHRALAVVARTYARYYVNAGGKHPQNNFDLDHHVDMFYRGYESDARMPNYKVGVDATRGMFITYQNDIVITPFFGESDGRTRSWEEKWGGDKPWLQSVSAPFSSTMRGHGVGMDANSARHMASEWGYSYSQIIHHFYTDIAIADRY
ncbi:SpoIID/LytB domain-containing protein [Patescibacteria group bacterium]